MNFEIDGVLNQVVRVDLEPGEGVWVQRRSLVSLSPGIRWTVRVPGGVPGMFLRALSGESFFLVRAEAREAGTVDLASTEPSIVYPWDLSKGPVTTLRGNFLGAVGDVDIEVAVARRPLAAFFGGAGLLLQTVRGTGTAFIAVKGDLTAYELESGGAIRVSTGNLAAFGATVDYDVRLVGGCRKMVFGGEGAVMTRIAGPGLALTQSLQRKGQTFLKILKILEMFA